MSADSEPVEITTYLTSADFVTDFPQGVFKDAVPGLSDVSVTFSGIYSVSATALTIEQVYALEGLPTPAVVDPLDEILAAAGIDEAVPSHWQRIHRARSFEAEQEATRKRLAAQWEPGKSERELS